MNIRERKIELRKVMEEKRASINAEERIEKEQRINERLIRICTDKLLASGQAAESAAPSLLTYMPFRSEPDVTPLMRWCWSQGIRTLLPRVVPDTKTMDLHIVQSENDLETGSYHIREPYKDSPVERNLAAVSMILVPGLAFDTEFGRLGYGGGYYDRFMQLFAAQGLPRPPAIAAAFDIQLIPQVPSSWHDFRVDGIVTESKELYK
ncbi:5-formyltetrahydrofolate cyclo-ligase [Paenibacillus hexagrammi]|uniref:5-formyltetrahydrofolate cyclo-ligase n=1 Tax=Paenibacillus hexagrammi TaxID=2908839 RepID=A0ABY3SMB2_9BACL|nr:5-formyltetrahydrofolate cyclo-ligase [Paenibacillus sp. YPD9-1]UJF34255.1 5-formyltetrahydrofolate cyclo-ligase [Paenibacillus sp. YPD9-1]